MSPSGRSILTIELLYAGVVLWTSITLGTQAKLTDNMLFLLIMLQYTNIIMGVYAFIPLSTRNHHGMFTIFGYQLLDTLFSVGFVIYLLASLPVQEQCLMQCIPSDYHSDFVFKAVVINALKIQLLGFWFVFFYGTQAEEEEDVEGIEWELEEIQEPLPAYVKDEEPPSYSLSRSVGSPNQQSISVP